MLAKMAPWKSAGMQIQALERILHNIANVYGNWVRELQSWLAAMSVLAPPTTRGLNSSAAEIVRGETKRDDCVPRRSCDQGTGTVVCVT